jgi:NAD(P)-dependent dehydrogenase (short-subunit alcohol dehydrogenase family)
MDAAEPHGGVVPETPLGRRADITELGAAVAFLVSETPASFTGTELVVDGFVTGAELVVDALTARGTAKGSIGDASVS